MFFLHLGFAGAHSQMNTMLYQNRPGEIEQICIWNPMTTRFITQTLIYVISMEFLSLNHKRFLLATSPHR